MPSSFRYPSSWTDIANQALGRLQSKLINRIDEGGTPANYCQLYLGEAIEDVYNEEDWVSAIKRMILTQLTEVPEFGYDHAYQMPVDFLRLVEGGGIESQGEDYSIEGNQLLTDADEVEIAYVARPEEPTKIAPHLKKAISTRLAFLLCIPLASSEETTSRVAAEYNDSIRAARSAEGKRKKETTVADDLGFTWSDELR